MAAALLAAGILAAPAAGRSLNAIEMRGVLSLCAHPNALPFASRRDDPAGFQIDLGREIARRLGVSLDVAWVVTPIQYRAAACDIVMDTILDPQVQAESRMQVSRAYHRSGVALALPGGAAGPDSFRSLDPKLRIGVQGGSLAQMLLGQRGLATTPFGFEDEMVEALAAGTIDAAAVSPATVGYFNLRNPGRALKLVHAYDEEPALAWDIAVGMRGADAPLKQRIDAALEAMLASGTIRDIYRRYGIEHRPPATVR